jgi:hypothetical protein
MAGGAHADGLWTKINHDDKATYYVDRSSEKSVRDVNYETLLVDYIDDSPICHRQIWSSIMRFRFNCQEHVVNIADVTYYGAKHGSGKVPDHDYTRDTVGYL